MERVKSKDQDEFEKLQSKLEGYKVLWKDFKDDSFIQMNSLVFIVLHNIIFCLILATMFEHLLAQVILINILSVVIIIYLIWFRPFDEKLELIQTIICETILFAVNLCLLILISLDSDSPAKENVGQTIIILTMIFNFVPLGFLVFTAIIIAKKVYHAIQAYLLKRKLDNLKKSGVHIKKNQISPIIIDSPKDETTTMIVSSKFIGNLTQTNSLALGKKDSVGTNLIYGDMPSHGQNFLSPPSKNSIQIEGSDNDDQSLNNESSPSKFSLVASRQRNLMRNSRQYWSSQKLKNENLESSHVFEA